MAKGNREARKELELLYGAKCMLTHIKTQLSYHHIIKKRDGGRNNIQNGALLNRVAHDYLHYLEINNKDLYRELNECLQCYKVAFEWQEKECLEEWEYVVKAANRELIKQKTKRR